MNNVNNESGVEQLKETLSDRVGPQPIVSNMNDEKMEVDESARNIEIRKSMEASDCKGLQKRDVQVSSEDESFNNI